MKFRSVLPIMLCVVFIAACSRAPAAPAVEQKPELIDAGPVPVQQVEVWRVSDPAETVRVVARGELPDECVRLGEMNVERADRQFNVTITASKLNSQTCSGLAVPFERGVALETKGLPPGSYTVTVNGNSTEFEIAPAEPEVVSASASGSQPAAVEQEKSSGSVPVTGEETAAQTQTDAAQLAQALSGTTSQPAETASSPAALSEEKSDCINKAAFFADVTIPDNTVLEPGEKFVKTWKLRNEGTCTWGADYSFVFVGGERMGAKESISLPAIQPGQTFDLSVDMAAPTGIGSYTGNWLFQDPAGNRFGVNSGGIDLIWVKIITNAKAPLPDPPGSTASCVAQGNPDYIQQVLALMNSERARNGLSALSLDNRLAAAAAGHSQDMACNNFVNHYGYNGSTWYDRIAAQGYSYGAASENIYAGNPAYGGDANGAFTWWMNSQVHRDAILNPKYTAAGVGYSFSSSAEYGGYYTVVFARPK